MRPPRSGHHVFAPVALGALLAVAAALSVLLAVAGCTAAGDQPQTLPPVSPEPTGVSNTPTATSPPSKSPRAQRRDEVERSVVSYFAAIEKSIGQGKTDEFEKATLPQCPCRRLVDTVKAIYGQGKAVEGYRIKLTNVTVGTVTEKTANVEVRHQQNAYNILSPDGQVDESVKHQSFVEDLLLQKVAGEWRVGRVVNVS